MLNYHLWTEEDFKNRGLIDDGIYKFQIKRIIKKKTRSGIDKNGNDKPIYDMIEIDFDFWDNQGSIRKIKDWITFIEGMDWKLRCIADTTGKLDLYEERTLDDYHLIDLIGYFKLSNKEIEEKDGTKRKINFVKDYIKRSSSNSESIDTDIPF